MPHQICLGDSGVIPLIGEGTMSLTCLVGGKPLTWLIHSVKYIPALTYVLLSCQELAHHGLTVVLMVAVAKSTMVMEPLLLSLPEYPITSTS